MKKAVFIKEGQVAIQDAPMPEIIEQDDAVIRVVRTCVCGSDLWAYRGDDAKEAGSDNSGHEIIGIVEKVGAAINRV